MATTCHRWTTADVDITLGSTRDPSVANEDLKYQRLKFSPFKSDDARELFGFMSDAKSMEHTYVAPSIELCLKRLNAYEEQRSKFGFAPWVIRSSKSGPIIGWGGLCGPVGGGREPGGVCLPAWQAMPGPRFTAVAPLSLRPWRSVWAW